MKNYKFLIIVLLFLLICVGCENSSNTLQNENTLNDNQEVSVKETKVSCSGPMASEMFESLSDFIKDDKMEIYATYDENESLKGIYYVYELTFAMSFEGESLDSLKSGLEKACDNKQFTSCNVNVESNKARIEAELDSSELKKNGTYSKESFKNEVRSLGSSWTCVEE